MKTRAIGTLAVFQLVTSALYTNAMEGGSNTPDVYYPPYESTESDDFWNDILDNSILDLELDDVPSVSYAPDQSTDQVDLSASTQSINDFHPSIESQMSTETRRNKEEPSHSFMKRQLGFARAKLQRSNMTWEEWSALLDVGDSTAMKIKVDFDKRCLREVKCATIKRKIKTHPNDESLKAVLRYYQESEEDRGRKRRVYEKRLPMCKHYRDKVDSLIRKVRKEIEEFNQTGRWSEMRSNNTERRRRQKWIAEQKRALNPKNAMGDAAAEQIIARLEELRLMLRRDPLNESMWGALWNEIDAFIQVDQYKYVSLGKPTISRDMRCLEGWSQSGDGGHQM